MSNSAPSSSNRRDLHHLAKQFHRLGWIGFWVQLILGFIPVFVLAFALLFQNLPNGNPGVNSWLILILAYGCLLALLFTLYWFFRYTRIAKKLDSTDKHPSKADIIRSLWIGLIANVVGMACAVMVAMGQVGTLLFKVLFIPQGAATIYRQTPEETVYSSGSIIVPFDLIALQAMVNTVAAELVGIIVALWLLSRVNQTSTRN